MAIAVILDLGARRRRGNRHGTCSTTERGARNRPAASGHRAGSVEPGASLMVPENLPTCHPQSFLGKPAVKVIGCHLSPILGHMKAQRSIRVTVAMLLSQGQAWQEGQAAQHQKCGYQGVFAHELLSK